MKIKRVAEMSDFDTVLSDLVGTPRLFVVMFGSEEEGTGESWCKDCVIADPMIRRTINKIEDSILVECPVGLRSEYKNNPEHPYRKHPQVKLTAVPTLIHWTPNGPGQRLVEDECADQAKLDAFVVASVATDRKRGVFAANAPPGELRPYVSQAVVANDNTVFVSGCIGNDRKTMKLVSDNVKDQTEQAIANIQTILESAGSSLKDVVKTTIMVQSMQDYQTVNEVYTKFFSGACPPARSAFAVAALPLEARVMIEAVAVLSAQENQVDERPAKKQRN